MHPRFYCWGGTTGGLAVELLFTPIVPPGHMHHYQDIKAYNWKKMGSEMRRAWDREKGIGVWWEDSIVGRKQNPNRNTMENAHT